MFLSWLIIVERISAQGFEWGIYSCNVRVYVCVCHAQECQFALTVGTHDHVHAQKLTCTDDGGRGQGQGRTALLDKLWRTRRTAWLVLRNVCVLQS